MDVAWEGIEERWYAIIFLTKIRCYVERITKMILIYKTLLYAKVVDFKILNNFCVDCFFMRRRFGTQLHILIAGYELKV